MDNPQKNFSILPKPITDALGAQTGVAVKLAMTVSFYAGQQQAKGYYEFLGTDGSILASGNKDISAIGWGENDSIMFTRLADALGIAEITPV
jgi:hypothetical protein